MVGMAHELPGCLIRPGGAITEACLSQKSDEFSHCWAKHTYLHRSGHSSGFGTVPTIVLVHAPYPAEHEYGPRAHHLTRMGPMPTIAHVWAQCPK